MPSDDVPRRMLVLLLELLKSGALPELAVGGAWACISDIMIRGSAVLCTAALESDICGLAVAHLQAVGSAADWVVSTRSVPLPARPRGCERTRVRWRRGDELPVCRVVCAVVVRRASRAARQAGPKASR